MLLLMGVLNSVCEIMFIVRWLKMLFICILLVVMLFRLVMVVLVISVV